MANFNGASRTNYFEVKSLEAFEKEMALYEVTVIYKDVGDKKLVGVYSVTEDGGWPTLEQLPEAVEEVVQDVLKRAEEYEFDATENTEELVEKSAEHLSITLTDGEKEHAVEVLKSGEGDQRDIDFDEIVANHLVDGEVAVLMSAGHEKARYVSGYATAIRNDCEHVSIVLSDIYELAAEKLGKLPTEATY